MKILILRIGRLGDMVMILPAIQTINQRFPQAELFAVTSKDGKRLLPQVGIKPENICVYRHALFYRLQDTQKVKRFINHSFDMIYCFETKPRTQSWLPPQSLCLQKTLELEHYSLRCLKLVGETTPSFPKRAYLPVLPQKEAHLKSLLLQQGITDKTLLIGFHPTYSGFNKWGRSKEKAHRLWHWKNFVLLAQLISEYAVQSKLDIQIMMDLLPSERAWGEKIQQACPNIIHLLDWPADFQRYLCLIQRLDVLIASNTGIMHLAAALRTPLVALFSQLHPEDCGPFMAKDRFHVLRAEDWQQPQRGLAAIPVEEVFLRLKQVLHSGLDE